MNKKNFLSSHCSETPEPQRRPHRPAKQTTLRSEPRLRRRSLPSSQNTPPMPLARTRRHKRVPWCLQHRPSEAPCGGRWPLRPSKTNVSVSDDTQDHFGTPLQGAEVRRMSFWSTLPPDLSVRTTTRAERKEGTVPQALHGTIVLKVQLLKLPLKHRWTHSTSSSGLRRLLKTQFSFSMPCMGKEVC